MENTFDITLLALAILTFIVWVLKTIVWPWISKKLPTGSIEVLKTAVKIGVYAAEAVWGRTHGEEKLKDAFKTTKDYLARVGITFDDEQIYEAIHAVWQELDISQRQAGIKN